VLESCGGTFFGEKKGGGSFASLVFVGIIYLFTVRNYLVINNFYFFNNYLLYIRR
jgi:hypothetical protein